jgi:hypothetical protein
MVCANLLRLVMVRIHLGLWAYHRGWLRLLVPLGASAGVVWGLWRWQGQVGEVLAMLLALMLAYLVFAAVAWVLCLDGDDRLLLGALWENVQRRLWPVAEGGAPEDGAPEAGAPEDEDSDSNPTPR